MKTLLAIDGSKFSEAASQMVASQLPAQNSEVLVAQVVEPLLFSNPPPMAPGYALEMAVRLQEQMEQAKDSVTRAAEVLRAEGFKVDSRVVEDEIRTGILGVAAEWHADLIVLGSHGKDRVTEVPAGKRYGVRRAPCPLLHFDCANSHTPLR